MKSLNEILWNPNEQSHGLIETYDHLRKKVRDALIVKRYLSEYNQGEVNIIYDKTTIKLAKKYGIYLKKRFKNTVDFFFLFS